MELKNDNSCKYIWKRELYNKYYGEGMKEID